MGIVDYFLRMNVVYLEGTKRRNLVINVSVKTRVGAWKRARERRLLKSSHESNGKS